MLNDPFGPKHTFTLKSGKVYKVHIIDVQEEIENLPYDFWKSEIPGWQGAKKTLSVERLVFPWFSQFLNTTKETYEKNWDIEKPSVETFEHITKISWVWLTDRAKILKPDVAVFWRIPRLPGRVYWLMKFPDAVNINNQVSRDFCSKGIDSPPCKEFQVELNIEKLQCHNSVVVCDVLKNTWNSRRNYVRNQEKEFFKERREIIRTKAMMELGPQINDVRDLTEEIISLTQNGKLNSDNLGAYLNKLGEFNKRASAFRAKLT